MARQQPKRKQKPGVSRKEQYRRQQRNSWIRFVSKLALFVVPIVGGTIWLIITLLGVGETLPIMTLDYAGGQSVDRSLQPVWQRVGFSVNDGTVDFNQQIAFGGPQRDAAIVFCDILGDVKDIEGQPRACLFVPSSASEHLNHRFRGVMQAETAAQQSQWMPVEDFLQLVIESLPDAQEGKVIFALDVDHPDAPGRQPPQANRFIEYCKQAWNQNRDQLNQKYQVFLWLSHDRQQASYQDSEPSRVESFFKHRFELAVAGDVVLENEGSTDISYQDLKRYLQNWVTSDSRVHKLAQSPVFLEPATFSGDPDFSLLSFPSSNPDPQPGALFDYRARSAEQTPDSSWKRFDQVSQRENWDLENPLLKQRAWMLLLQMERLWLAAHHDTELYRALESQLNSVLASETTIKPFQHSLHDALQASREKPPANFELEWLDIEPDSEDSAKSLAAKKTNQQRQEQIAQWSQAMPDWRGAMSVWLALVQEEDRPVTQPMIASALASLGQQQRIVPRPESGNRIEDLARVPWNEIAYLQRLNEDLIWPTAPPQLERFQKMVQLSLRVRNNSNEFVAKLVPVLSQKFADPFEKLESRRRSVEDRMFANQLDSVEADFGRLLSDYRQLADQHQSLADQVADVQAALVRAPHDLPYLLSSLSTVTFSEMTQQDQVPEVATQFRNLLEEPEAGYLDVWRASSRQMIGALMDQTAGTESDALLRLTSNALQAAANDESRPLASNPDNDLKRLLDSLEQDQGVGPLGIADGNLLARRLLVWPGVDSVTRAKIHRGLSKPELAIENSRVNEQGASQNADFNNPQAMDWLSETYRNPQLGQLLSLQDDPIPYNPGKSVSGDENFFVRLAFGAHRRLARRSQNDQSSLNVALAINDFRSRKSDLQFRRVATDLWATPVVEGNRKFVIAALTNHAYVMADRIDAFAPPSEAIAQGVNEIWQESPKQQWSADLAQITKFCKDFQLFQWERDQQQPFNTAWSTSPPIPEQDWTFAVYPERKFESVSPAELDSGVLTQTKTNGDLLSIDFRGHHIQLAVTRRAEDPDEVSISTRLNRTGKAGTTIAVKRADRGPVNGHVTLAIDCSASMQKKGRASSNRLERAKRDVLAFLEDLSQRGDIAVSLVAFGAGEKFRFPEPDFIKTRDAREVEQLNRWKVSADADVWVYRGSGAIVDPESIAGFRQAIDQLEPYGETPLVTAIDGALKLAQGQNQNLIVLLTDGFEFGHRNATADDPYAPFDDRLYQQVKAKLRGRNELVLFSYLPGQKDPVKFREMLENEFKRQIQSEDEPNGIPVAEIIRRIKNIERLADERKIRHPGPNEENALKSFFDELLPRPFVHARQDNETMFRKPIVYRANANQGFLLEEQIGTSELPQQNWSISVEFSDPKIAARGFANDNANWNTTTPLVGNESLQFIYEPFGPSFRLFSGSVTDPHRVDFEGTPLMVGRAGNDLRRKPYFEIVSAEADQLTPAPQLAIVEYREATDSNHRLLLQDFNLREQVSSNVHPIEFPQFQDELRRAEFGPRPLEMRLKMLRTIPVQLWSKIRFTEQNDQQVSNDQQTLALKPGDFASVNELLPKNGKFGDYQITMRRSGKETEYATYTIRVESDQQPLDRWIINVVGANNQIDDQVTKRVDRRYVYRDDGRGQKQLIRIEHDFRINKNELRNAKVFFGFAHVDELQDATSMDPKVFVD